MTRTKAISILLQNADDSDYREAIQFLVAELSELDGTVAAKQREADYWQQETVLANKRFAIKGGSDGNL